MTYSSTIPSRDGSPLMPDAVAVFAADCKAIEARFDAPYSTERRSRLKDILDGWSDWVDALAWGSLVPSDRIDAALLANLIEAERAQLRLEQSRFDKMAELCPVVAELIGLLDARRRLDDFSPRVAARTLHEVARSLRDPSTAPPQKVSGVLANRLAKLLETLKKPVADWYAFHAGYDPLSTWWLQAPYAELTRALDEVIPALRKAAGDDSADAIVGDPVGRDALMADLRTAMISYTPEELIRIGEMEMEWCRRELTRAARDLGCGDDWRAALEKVKEDHVPPGEQAAFVRDLAREAVAFIEAQDLMTVPPLARDGWRIEMMSPERQKVNPFFLGGEAIIVSYPTDAMDHDLKLMSMRGNNRHFSRATVQHELIPGHFMQHFCGERYRPYRRVFHTPFWTEGWTLYWELRLWDLGFARTPEERVGMLFWRMHRCARIVFSLRFHLGEMSPQECVTMLVEDVGHERATAEGEVRRSFGGDYPPLYQCAYMIGGLQMRALRDEMVGERSMTERQFHDAVMHENCMPPTMLRALLREDSVERHVCPTWRFYDAIP